MNKVTVVDQKESADVHLAVRMVHSVHGLGKVQHYVVLGQRMLSNVDHTDHEGFLKVVVTP